MARLPGTAACSSNHTPRHNAAAEICRAYHDGSTADQLAERFQLHGDTVRAIVRDFARDPDIDSFFTARWPGPKSSPKRTAIQERACDLRRQGHTLAEIRATLLREDSISANPISSASSAAPV